MVDTQENLSKTRTPPRDSGRPLKSAEVPASSVCFRRMINLPEADTAGLHHLIKPLNSQEESLKKSGIRKQKSLFFFSLRFRLNFQASYARQTFHPIITRKIRNLPDRMERILPPGFEDPQLPAESDAGSFCIVPLAEDSRADPDQSCAFLDSNLIITCHAHTEFTHSNIIDVF